MGDNWDDDDFEPEVQSLAPPPPVVDTVPEPAPAVAPPPAAKTQKKTNALNMESFSRELSAAEREEMQRRQELALTLEMFGGCFFLRVLCVFRESVAIINYFFYYLEKPCTGDERPYSDILTKDEFEDWGLKVGTFLATRHKAAHYGDMLNKLIQTITENLEASELRTMSNYLKTLADSKKAADKVKPAPGTKKAPKATLKVTKASNKKVYDDYDGADDYDDFDDDDFM
ncbi:translation initiation factor eIF3 subunit [Cooperia oncophora]